MNTTSDIRVLFVQDGARRHFAVPLALQRAGMLDTMYAEWFVRPHSLTGLLGQAVKLVRPRLGQAMLNRRCEQIEPSRVRTHPSLLPRQIIERRKARSETDFYARKSALVAKWILRTGFGDANVIAGFIRNIHPRVLKQAKQGGLYTLGDQIIAPAAIEQRQAQEQQERWPRWEPPSSLTQLDEVERFERETWRHLDCITCGSDYVADGLLDQGVPLHRINVIPYPLDVDQYQCIERKRDSNRLTVGFVGNVSLRKGAPYFMEVARRLASPSCRFTLVGRVCVSSSRVAEYANAVECVGAVGRSAVKDWLHRFDLLLFPSTCEGSAGAIREAMATGLPIVTSPNSGSVVRHGQDGFIRPYDDIDGLTEAVQQLISDRELRRSMGRSARHRIEQFNVNAYGRKLAETITDLVHGGVSDAPLAPIR